MKPSQASVSISASPFPAIQGAFKIQRPSYRSTSGKLYMQDRSLRVNCCGFNLRLFLPCVFEEIRFVYFVRSAELSKGSSTFSEMLSINQLVVVRLLLSFKSRQVMRTDVILVLFPRFYILTSPIHHLPTTPRNKAHRITSPPLVPSSTTSYAHNRSTFPRKANHSTLSSTSARGNFSTISVYDTRKNAVRSSVVRSSC